MSGCKPQSSKLDVNGESPVTGNEHVAVTEKPGLGWPAIYGPRQNSISLETNINTDWSARPPRELWRIKLGLGSGYSTPVSVGDQTFILYRQNDEEILACLDPESGETVWDFRRPTSFKCGWENYSDGPYSTPLVVGDSIYFVSSEGVLHRVYIESGKEVWSRNLFLEFSLQSLKWPVVASPAISDGILVFNLGASEQTAGIIGIDCQTGATVWTATSHCASHTTPLVTTMHDKTLAFVLTANALVCLDPKNGEVFWELEHRNTDLDGMYSNAVSPVALNNRVVIISGPFVKPGIRCLEIAEDLSYYEPWKNIRLLNSQYTNPIVVGGFLFGMTSMKQGGPELRCVNLKTGKLAWKDGPDLGRANGLAAGDAIILLGEKGEMATIEINHLKMVVRSRLEKPILKGPCYTPMALNNGRLYLRNEKYLVCLDLKNLEAVAEVSD